MPMLVLAVPEDFDKLLEDGCLAAITPLGKLGRIMVVAIDLAIVFVVAVRRAKYCWTHRTGKVVDMVFAVESSDVGCTKSLAALVAEETQASEVIRLAKGVLAVAILIVDGEEFRGDNLSTVLYRGSETDA